MKDLILNDILFALIGGTIIAIASTLNLLMMGRISGISGAIFTVWQRDVTKGLFWKISFLNGILLLPILIYYIIGRDMDFGKDGDKLVFFDEDSVVTKGVSIVGFAIGGFLVGFGTKMGNGCTSGHGVCGLPRLALRSIVAVCTFMITGFIFQTVKYHKIGFLNHHKEMKESFQDLWWYIALVTFVFLQILQVFLFIKVRELFKELILSYLFGALFGLGLVLSGMCRISKILGFLTLDLDVFDPSLAFVLGAAVVVNFITFNWIIKIKKEPMLQSKLDLPENKSIDWKLILGAAIFGIGWATGGLCPGPGIIAFFVYGYAFIWVIMLIVGQAVEFYFEKLVLKT